MHIRLEQFAETIHYYHEAFLRMEAGEPFLVYVEGRDMSDEEAILWMIDRFEHSIKCLELGLSPTPKE